MFVFGKHFRKVNRMDGGSVSSRTPGITSASRYTESTYDEHIDDSNLQEFLKEIYSFKQYLWNEFIQSKQSQSPDITDEYIVLLKKMYDCIINNKDCNHIPYKTFNSSNISLSRLMNNIDRIQSEYWLKRTLINFPFTLNMNKILGNN